MPAGDEWSDGQLKNEIREPGNHGAAVCWGLVSKIQKLIIFYYSK